MNEDIFAGQWKEMRGASRSWWGKLTDDDFEWIGGCGGAGSGISIATILVAIQGAVPRTRHGKRQTGNCGVDSCYSPLSFILTGRYCITPQISETLH